MIRWLAIWFLCVPVFAQNINITNVPFASGIAPTDSMLGLTNNHTALLPVSSLPISANQVTGTITNISGNGSGVTNVAGGSFRSNWVSTSSIADRSKATNFTDMQFVKAVGTTTGIGATSNNAAVFSGCANSATNTGAMVLGGIGCIAGGPNSLVLSGIKQGGGNTAFGGQSTVVNGQDCQTWGNNSFNGGGNDAVIGNAPGDSDSCKFSSIVTGNNMELMGRYCFIGGGQNGGIGSALFDPTGSGSDYCFIGTGDTIQINLPSYASGIVVGQHHTLTGTNSFIGGGSANTIAANMAAILGGENNTAGGSNSFVIGSEINMGASAPSNQVWIGIGSHVTKIGATGSTNTDWTSLQGTTLNTLTPSRVVLTDASRNVSSASASGAVSINADGTATTFAQINALASGNVVTQGNSFSMTFSNALAVDKAHAFFPSNSTPSKVAVIGADNTLTNSGLGAVPINGDGTATTAAQVTALGVTGYNMDLWTAGSLTTPADSTTYYIGGDPNNGTTSTYTDARLEIPKTGTVKYVVLKVRVAGTLGTSETVQHFIRLNDTTDFAQINTTYDAVTRDVHATGVSQAVNAGDFIALKIVTPAWVTNPTTVRYRCVVYIE